jgi:hypothetical protein
MSLVQRKPTNLPNLSQVYLKSRKPLYQNENEPQVQRERELLDCGFDRGIDFTFLEAGIELKILEVLNR